MAPTDGRTGAEPAPPRVLALLAEPIRWALVQHLAESDRRVGELVALLGRPQSIVSYHLGELRDAGLVAGRRSAADGRDVYYRFDAAACRALLGGVAATLYPGTTLTPAGNGLAAPRRNARVLFLCTGNSARSQMAEALLARRCGAVTARSAGSHPKPLHPHAVRVMAERGIDIAGRKPKALGRFTAQRFDRVVTLCDRVREVCPDFPRAGARAHWSMPDPAAAGAGEDSLPAFRAAADELEARTDLLAAQLIRPATGATPITTTSGGEPS